MLPHMIVGLGLLVYPLLMGMAAISGEEVKAIVSDKVSYRDSDGDKRYKLEVDYIYANKDCYEKFQVDREKFALIKRGETVYVRFLPAAREWTQQVRQDGTVYDVPSLSTVAFFVFFALFWNAIVSVFFVVLYVAPVLNWWLLRYGVPAPAQMVGKSIDSTSDDGDRYRVEYSFTQGKKQASISSQLTVEPFKPGKSKNAVTSSTLTGRNLWESLNPGDKLCVLYLPAYPKVNLCLELSEYELAD